MTPTPNVNVGIGKPVGLYMEEKAALYLFVYPLPLHFLQNSSPHPLHALHSLFETLRPMGSLCAAVALASSSKVTPDILPVPSQAKQRTPPLPAQEVQTSGSPFSPLARAAPTAPTTAPPMRTSCISAGSVALQICRVISLEGAIGRRLWRLTGRLLKQ